MNMADLTRPRIGQEPRVKHVGEVIRSLREYSGLTRKQLGTEIGVAPSTLRNIEMGRHIPTAWILRKLLNHPSMATLEAQAADYGVEVFRKIRKISPRKEAKG